MNLEQVNNILTLRLDYITTTAIAFILLAFGFFIRNKYKIFQRMTIPASVIGGFICAIFILTLHSSNILYVEMDMTLQLPFMLAFFTCVGFSGSFQLLKKGGRLLIVYLIATWILAVVQCIIGVSLAKALQINPILGVMAGTVSLVGGHGNAAAFGPIAENAGAVGATAVAVASATFGLVFGSLLGGPVGDLIIRRKKITVTADVDHSASNKKISTNTFEIDTQSFLSHLTVVFIFMACGVFISLLFGKFNIKNLAIPNYVGAMFMSILFININNKYQFFKFNQAIISLIGDVSLSVFLTMAIMSLRIWELADLAAPLVIILIVQTIVLFLFVMLLLFPILRGKNKETEYDAAVLSGGFMGWGLGIAATAVVCMSAIVEKYRKSAPNAFVIAPLCGAVFVDIVAIPTIIFFITKFS